MLRKTPLRAKTPLKTKTAMRTKSPLKASASLRTTTKLKPAAPSANRSAKPRKLKSTAQLRTDGSVLTADMGRCYITGDTHDIHVHHIFGAANKGNSEKYRFLVPLRSDWHNMASYGVHFNKELDLKLKRECEEYWLVNYGTQDEFIKIFGKWW